MKLNWDLHFYFIFLWLISFYIMYLCIFLISAPRKTYIEDRSVGKINTIFFNLWLPPPSLYQRVIGGKLCFPIFKRYFVFNRYWNRVTNFSISSCNISFIIFATIDFCLIVQVQSSSNCLIVWGVWLQFWDVGCFLTCKKASMCEKINQYFVANWP